MTKNDQKWPVLDSGPGGGGVWVVDISLNAVYRPRKDTLFKTKTDKIDTDWAIMP